MAFGLRGEETNTLVDVREGCLCEQSGQKSGLEIWRKIGGKTHQVLGNQMVWGRRLGQVFGYLRQTRWGRAHSLIEQEMSQFLSSQTFEEKGKMEGEYHADEGRTPGHRQG